MRNIVRLFPRSRALATYERPLESVGRVLKFAMQLRDCDRYMPACQHGKRHVAVAKEQRELYLENFGRALTARGMLYLATREMPSRQTAIAMIADLLGGLGQKADQRMLAAMLLTLDSDDAGVASGLWKPTKISTVSLALACQRLIVTTKKYVPKSGEFHAACVDAHELLTKAERSVSTFVDRVRSYDAILLDFDREEWERPYLTRQAASMLRPMLDLHYHEGEGREDADDRHPFQRKVLAELAKIEGLDSPPLLAAD